MQEAMQVHVVDCRIVLVLRNRHQHQFISFWNKYFLFGFLSFPVPSYSRHSPYQTVPLRKTSVAAVAHIKPLWSKLSSLFCYTLSDKKFLIIESL